MRQIAATRRRDTEVTSIPRVTCENHCRCDRILSLRSVARIQSGLNCATDRSDKLRASSLVAAAVQTRRLVAAMCCSDLSHRVSRPILNEAILG